MDKKGAHAHIRAYDFWANWVENSYENSGNYYLSIGDEKTKLWCLFFIFDFLGHFWRVLLTVPSRARHGSVRARRQINKLPWRICKWTSILNKHSVNEQAFCHDNIWGGRKCHIWPTCLWDLMSAHLALVKIILERSWGAVIWAPLINEIEKIR